jgi:hypothetical protein
MRSIDTLARPSSVPRHIGAWTAAALALLACSSPPPRAGAQSPSGAATTPTAAADRIGPAADFSDFGLLATIVVPSDPVANPDGVFKFFDISFVDPKAQRYFLADRSNAAVDEFDAATHVFLRRFGGFSGQKFKDAAKTMPDNDHSGPDGVVAIHSKRQVWAGDGDSTVKVIDLRSHTIIDSISTGGAARADEMAFDPRDDILLVVNNADAPPFVTLISTKPPRKVLGRITFDAALGTPFGVSAFTDGLEQPVFDRTTGVFYLSVPELDGDAAKGAIAVIDPRAAAVTQLHRIEDCHPAGLALAPGGRLLAGCSDPSRSLILDATTGNVLANVMQVGGSDEVWFNPGDDQFYLAARNNPGGPVLGVIDAASGSFTTSVATATNAHSVAANPRNNHVFVPLTPNPQCGSGCIGVYGITGAGGDEDGEDRDDGGD